MTALTRLSVMLLLAAFLSGCGQSEHEDLKLWMQEASKDLKGRIPPLPEVKAYEPITYEVAGLLDPFKAAKLNPVNKAGGGGIQPDFNRAKEALENYPLDSLKYVGYLMRGKMSYAIVQADSSLHQVKMGNYMGQNFGIITDIDESQIVLRELVQEISGDWVERTSSLQLQETGETK